MRPHSDDDLIAIVEVHTSTEDMARTIWRLREALRLAIRGLDTDGPASAAATLNVQGRAVLAAAEGKAAPIVRAVNEYEALRSLETAARSDSELPLGLGRTKALRATSWLVGLLDWCRDNELVQRAIAEDEDPSAITEHFTEARLFAERSAGALDALDALRRPSTGKTGEAAL